MIVSFKDKRTEVFFGGGKIAEFVSFNKTAERKLVVLDSAPSLSDLAEIPGNRLEKLLGKRNGQHSIRINDQWRICFIWRADGPHDVEITDYH
jgi:proteic killer suppression protein